MTFTKTCGHARFRLGCRSRLAGADRDRAHVRVERPDERAIPVLPADCCFMGERDDDEANARRMPIFVMKFDVGKWMHSHAVPHKGTRHPWGARELTNAMVQSGFLKPQILQLKRAAIRLASEETATEVVPEESNEYISQTRGFVEQAVQAVERKVRTLTFSVEGLHDVTLPPNHPLLVRAMEYASQITNRSHRYIGEGGTAFELRRGKPHRGALPSFREKVTAMVLGKRKLNRAQKGFYSQETIGSSKERWRLDHGTV